MSRPKALVTGAGIRVGRAIALELASAGFDVAVHFNRSQGPAEEVVARCREEGAEAWSVQADLGQPEGVDQLVEQLSARWDRLHLLVNNASIFEQVPFEQIQRDVYDQMLQINLHAPFFLSQGLLPLLRAAEGEALGAPPAQRGVVVHLCDVGADRPVSGYAHYSVSKAGLVMLVKAMAVELAPQIRTVGISPGQVAWPESYPATLRERLTRRIPLQRAGVPEDVAKLVRFVALEGHYLNGIILPVDGGLSARY